jgi:hypothetical protein
MNLKIACKRIIHYNIAPCIEFKATKTKLTCKKRRRRQQMVYELIVSIKYRKLIIRVGAFFWCNGKCGFRLPSNTFVAGKTTFLVS